MHTLIELNDKTKVDDYDYYKTLKGKVTRIYSHQRYNSKHKRGHPYPEYTKDELMRWFMAQPNFKTIWQAWIDSGYSRDLSPSVDRLDSTQHYTLDNIRLTTWADNNYKGRKEHPHNGVFIEQYNLDGGYVDTYKTTYEAGKQSSVPSGNIDKVCRGERSQAGGYKWKRGSIDPTQFDKVRLWARTRGLIAGGDSKTQTLKIMEELGELSRALLKQDGKEVVDSIGDILVTIVVLSDLLDIKAEECWQEAIDTIVQRKGKMVNGTFIKGQSKQLKMEFGDD